MDKHTMDGFDPQEMTVLFIKNETNEIWSYTAEFKGHTQFHIREVYFQNDVWKPGKGISIPIECKDDFLAGLFVIRFEQA